MEKPQTKIAIVGMAGSGKTVLTTVLATKLSQKADQGVFLTPVGENLRQTLKYVQQNWQTLQNGQWPPSTPAGEVANLRWILKTGSTTAEVRFADFAGQDIHAIFSSDHFNPEQFPKDQRQLFTYLNSANILLILVNMEDLLGKGSNQALENSIDLYQIIYILSQKNDKPRKIAVVFSQYDRYRAEVDQRYNGNLIEYFRANLPQVYNEYIRTKSFELFPVAAVEQTQKITDNRGNVVAVPQRDFSSYNIDELIQWITNGIEGLTQSPIKKWAIRGILAGVILLGIVLGMLMINTGNQDNWMTMMYKKIIASPDVTVPTDVSTLAEAYEKVPSNGIILLNRGVHKVPKTITITKNVTIKGDVNNPEYVVLQGGEESVFHLQSGFAEIAGLTIQNEGKEGSLSASNIAVLFSAPLGVIHDCVFTSTYGRGFVVNTKDSKPDVKNCTARNCGLQGFYIGSGALGTFRNCTASGNAYPGMEVRDAKTSPMVEDCQFNDGKQSGVFVCDGASGTFRKCTASGNAKSGMEVRDANTNPTVEDCQFTDGKVAGILVSKGASGTFRNCTASGNAVSGMQVSDANTNPTVEDGTFEKNQGSGVWVWLGASGTFRRNKLSGNSTKFGNWDVSGAASNLVREGNTPNE